MSHATTADAERPTPAAQCTSSAGARAAAPSPARGRGGRRRGRVDEVERARQHRRPQQRLARVVHQRDGDVLDAGRRRRLELERRGDREDARDLARRELVVRLRRGERAEVEPRVALDRRGVPLARGGGGRVVAHDERAGIGARAQWSGSAIAPGADARATLACAILRSQRLCPLSQPPAPRACADERRR